MFNDLYPGSETGSQLARRSHEGGRAPRLVYHVP